MEVNRGNVAEAEAVSHALLGPPYNLQVKPVGKFIHIYCAVRVHAQVAGKGDVKEVPLVREVEIDVGVFSFILCSDITQRRKSKD